MIVLELLVAFLMVCFVGLVITQFIVPTIKGTETWWLFKRNHPIKNLSSSQVELETTKTEVEVEAVKQEIKQLKNRKK